MKRLLAGIPMIAAAVLATGIPVQAAPTTKSPTMITIQLKLLSGKDIVRGQLLSNGRPLYEGILSLWEHNADTSTWTLVGSSETKVNGWTHIYTEPVSWQAYRWTFAGNSAFEASVSATVAT
jgi:hypothetical protein